MTDINLHNRAHRRITRAMFEAQIRVEMLPMRDVSRADILRNLRRGRKELGLTRQQTELLCYLSSWTDEDDWCESGQPVCTAHNETIQREFDIGRTRVKVLLRQLAEEGWIIHRDSPNGKRYRRRHPHTGQTLYVYGLDLSPLSRRYEEIERAACTVKEREREGDRLHCEVMQRARRIYTLIEAGRDIGLRDDVATNYGQQAYNITQQRGFDRDITTLSALCEELSVLEESLENSLSLQLAVESDPMGPPENPHYTTTTHKDTSTYVEDVSKADTPIEIKRSRMPETPSQSSPLRGFNATPTFLLQIAPQFRDYCSTSRPSKDDIMTAALMASDKMGISRHAWQQGNAVLGAYENTVALAIIAARQIKGEITSAGGYLRGMINRHLNGELAMDRTLYGLKN